MSIASAGLDPGAPVLLTGNFPASVEAVCVGLAGRDAHLIVEDTDGWNVWWAGDAGRTRRPVRSTEFA